MEYKTVSDGDYTYTILLQITIDGKMSLYEDVYEGFTNPAMTGGLSMNNSTTTYYISKQGSNEAVNLRVGTTYSKRFRKIAQVFFEDCPDLLEKINSKSYFKRYGIKEVINFYNAECQ